jgi:hypothetical protein
MDVAVVVLAGVLTGEVNPPNRCLLATETSSTSEQTSSSIWRVALSVLQLAVSYPELVVFVAVDADGPVRVRPLEESVGPPPRHVDVRGVRHVHVGEHPLQHRHGLRLGRVVRLPLDPPRLVVSDGDQQDVGVRVLSLEGLPHPVVATPAARVHEELLALAHGPEPRGELEEDLGVHAHIEPVDRHGLPELVHHEQLCNVIIL